MKMTIEWSKEELEEMIREKLAEAGFEPEEEGGIKWKTRPELHIVIQARVNPELAKAAQSESVPPQRAPEPGDGFHGDGKLPADMFPDGADVEGLAAAAAEEDELARQMASLRPMHPGETKGDPRGDND